MQDFDLKDPGKEKRIFQSRAMLCWVLVVVLLGLIVVRMFHLQVVQYDRHATVSDNNRMLVQPIAPNRGMIYDRNGILLADNRASYSLNITPEQVKDIDALILELGSLIQVSEQEVEDYKVRRQRRRRPYQSVSLKSRLTEEQMAHIAVNAHRFPGVSVEAELIRYYPLAGSTAHSVGYVGRINEAELKTLDMANYSATHKIGKLGIEKFYEAQLHGQAGWQKVEINARGRVLKVLERQPPKPGVDITLWLDSALQRAAEQALGDRRGAVVAIDTRSGGILALVSNPTFDPNLFVSGMGVADYAQLKNSPDLPMFNRALQGQYPPGSTIKPFVALAGLQLGYTNWHYSVYDPGWYQLNKEGRFYRDWKKYGHGRVDLKTAITQSCDTYFYDLAHRFDINLMHDFLVRFGLGRNTALDLGEALQGLLPSEEWKKNRLGVSWYPGDSLNAAIGQGYMLTTPMQLATATMALANRGRWVQPRLLKQIDPSDALSVQEAGLQEQTVQQPQAEFPEDIQLKDPQNWDKMIAAMENVMVGERGTARTAGKGLVYRMAGKTGTAQVVGIKQDEKYDASIMAERNKDHALFIAFAPVEQPEIAIAVIVENGGGGGSTAAPVARKVLDVWLGAVDS